MFYVENDVVRYANAFEVYLELCVAAFVGSLAIWCASLCSSSGRAAALTTFSVTEDHEALGIPNEVVEMRQQAAGSALLDRLQVRARKSLHCLRFGSLIFPRRMVLLSRQRLQALSRLQVRARRSLHCLRFGSLIFPRRMVLPSRLRLQVRVIGILDCVR